MVNELGGGGHLAGSLYLIISMRDQARKREKTMG